MPLSVSGDRVRFIGLGHCPFEREAEGRKSGVFSADSMGVSPFRSGVEVVESNTLGWKPLDALTALKEVETGSGCGEGCGCVFTGVKPPEFAAVNPDMDGGGRSPSVGGVAATSL